MRWNAGVYGHRKIVCTESWSGRKIPCRTGESNLRQQRAGPMLCQLSYIPVLSAAQRHLRKVPAPCCRWRHATRSSTLQTTQLGNILFSAKSGRCLDSYANGNTYVKAATCFLVLAIYHGHHRPQPRKGRTTASWQTTFCQKIVHG